MRKTNWIILASLMLFLVAGCNSTPTPPSRPNGVPLTAVWAGGPDGGSFIECVYDVSKKLNLCTVYSDFKGDVIAHGFFNISGKTKASDTKGFQYSAFDGQNIYLMDNSILKPVATK